MAVPDAATEAGAALAASPEIAATGGLVGWSMLIATEGGEPADADAAAAVSQRPAVELSKMYAHPAAHGSGIAGELMRATLDEAARGRGIRRLARGEPGERAGDPLLREARVPDRRTKRFLVGDRWEHDYVLERPMR